MKVLHKNRLKLGTIAELAERPPVFAEVPAEFRDEHYQTTDIQSVHLAPDIELSERRHDDIAHAVDWIARNAELKRKDAILDLGCGLGQFCIRFALNGFTVTGIDISRKLVAFAVAEAAKCGVDAEFRYENPLEMQYAAAFDLVTLFDCEFCMLAPDQQKTLLARTAIALRDGGHLALNVWTPCLHERRLDESAWYALNSGFWKPVPHIVLEQRYGYPDDVFLTQYLVLDEGGNLSAYRNWLKLYAQDRITRLLDENGFEVTHCAADFTGSILTSDSMCIALIARKKSG